MVRLLHKRYNTDMTRTHARLSSLLAVPALLAGAVLAAPSAGAANPTYSFDWSIKASTHLQKLNQTVSVPKGTFKGQVDLVTQKLTGSISLPPASTTLQVAGVGLATATFKIAQVKPVTGTVSFSTLQAKATSVFDIKVTKVAPALAPSVNLVGDSCKTSTPVQVTMSGTANLTTASTFKGTYTIPPLAGCGLLTAVLNQLVPGPGYTFTAVAAPK
jgi:hypothetical protein